MADRIQMESGVTGSEAPVEEVAQDRPEWLPEKFASAEDMAKAYGELESRMSSEPQQAEEQHESVEADDASEEPMGMDVDSIEDFSNEFFETGDLSEESFERIENEFGISQDIARAYVEGQKALVAQAQQTIFAEVGGEETYREMLEWAGNNLNEAEINAYDSAIVSNDMETALMVARGLYAQYVGAEGSNPSLSSGTVPSAGGGEGYANWQQVSADMAKPEYTRDASFREMVKNRLSNSSLS
jgi:hypothetical protein